MNRLSLWQDCGKGRDGESYDALREMAALADFARQLECAAAGLQGSESERVSSNAWLVEVAGHGESPRLCEALLRDGLCASHGHLRGFGPSRRRHA